VATVVAQQVVTVAAVGTAREVVAVATAQEVVAVAGAAAV
jgi:hypothetical protein